MASKDFGLLNMQNDDQEIDLQFIDTDSHSPKYGESSNEQTIYFSEFPDSATDDTEEKNMHKRKKRKLVETDEKKSEIVVKLIADETKILPILSENLIGPVKFVDVVVVRIRETKFISKVVKLFSTLLPVTKLGHLKRIKRQIIDNESAILIYISFLEDFCLKLNEIYNESNLNLLDAFSCKNIWKILFEKGVDKSLFHDQIYICRVAQFPPKLQNLYELASKMWPCTFHEDTYSAKLLSGAYFSADDRQNIVNNMNIALNLAEDVNEKNEISKVALIFNDKSKQFVGGGKDARSVHPLWHSSMVAIDNVSSKQNCENLNLSKMEEFYVSMSDVELACEAGCEQRRENISVSLDRSSEKRDLSYSKDGSCYICTDCHIYMSDEPCLMCAMALLHSRISRIFFFRHNKMQGALNSICKLHTLPWINHRYEVFELSISTCND